MRTIVTVCMGNIFRSPVAEELINRQIEELGLSEKIHCTSRGIQGQNGVPSPKFPTFSQYKQEFELARPVLEKYGIDIGNHEAKPIDAEIVQRADLILVLEGKIMHDNEFGLVTQYPQAAYKMRLLSTEDNPAGISDPAELRNTNKYEFIVPQIIKSVEDMKEEILRIGTNQEGQSQSKERRS